MEAKQKLMDLLSSQFSSSNRHLRFRVMSPRATCRPSSVECCIFNPLDDWRASVIRFMGDSCLSPPADDDITTPPSRRSPAPETSHDAPDQATSKASQSSSSCGSLASLPGLGLALGSGCLGAGSNEPPRNLSRAIAVFAQLVTAPGTR